VEHPGGEPVEVQQKSTGILLAVKHAQLEQEHARTLARIAVETASDVPVGYATAGGDTQRLRGLPAVGPGCGGGAIPGTRPEAALFAKERRRLL